MISIAITTRNRPSEFDLVLSKIKEYTKIPHQLIIVDDASDEPYCNATHRFEERSGIPAAKNKCLVLAKHDHIFLFDDDTYPIANGWYEPYMNSGKEHLCYTFLKSNRQYNWFKYHRLGNGCMMYLTRKCLDIVGGFDWRFGLGKYEHVNLSHRICNAGLIEEPFVDVIGSDKLLYCMDQDKGFQRSFTRSEINKQLNLGRSHFNKSLKSKEYIGYETKIPNNK